MADLLNHWLGGFLLLALQIIGALVISRGLWVAGKKVFATIRGRFLPAKRSAAGPIQQAKAKKGGPQP